MRLVKLAFAFHLLVTLAGCEAQEKLSDRADEAAAKLATTINAEIMTLPEHSWAGSYYKGDGLGENVSLVLAPKNGHLFEWHGCLGLYDRNYGAVDSQDETVRLTFTLPNVQKGFQGIPEEFRIVDWGDRKYLIPSDDLVGFCNAINSGDEPRKHVHGSYLLRDGDEKKKTNGLPEIPRQFKQYLLAKPLVTTIISVGDSKTRPSVCEWNFKDTTVELGNGKADGILPGMKLFVVEPENVHESLKIESAEDDRSNGIIIQFEDDAVAIEAGWKLSTRPRWRAK